MHTGSNQLLTVGILVQGAASRNALSFEIALWTPLLPRTFLNTGSRSLRLRKIPKLGATDSESEKERGMTDRKVTLAPQLISILSSQVCTLTDKWAPLKYINTINKSAIMPPISILRLHCNLIQQCASSVSRWAIYPLAQWFRVRWVYHRWQWHGGPSLHIIHNWYEYSCALQKNSSMSLLLLSVTLSSRHKDTTCPMNYKPRRILKKCVSWIILHIYLA